MSQQLVSLIFFRKRCRKGKMVKEKLFTFLNLFSRVSFSSLQKIKELATNEDTLNSRIRKLEQERVNYAEYLL